MANILLLTLVFAPDGVSTSVLMTELASDLQQLGHNVTVLTTTPHYNVEPEARERQPLKRLWGGLLYHSTYNGIPVYHAAIPEKGSRVGARLLDYARFHLISAMVGLFKLKKFDLILAPSPPLTIGMEAWGLGLLKRVPFIYNVQEIYPDVAVSLGVLKNPFVIKWLERLERFTYTRAKVVSVISEKFRLRLLEKGTAPDKLRVIPNFVDTTFASPGERHNDFSVEHNLNDKFVVLYAGNIGLTQGFETILAAARKLQDVPDLVFLIVGDGTRRSWLEEELAKEPADNVKVLPYQPRSTVPNIYATSDLCLVPLKKGTAQETFPSKIYTIMASGRPVLVSADPDSELEAIVQQSGCGWAVPPDDAESLANTVREVYANRQQAKKRGELGRAYVVDHHSRQAVAQQYDALIREVVAHG